MWLIPYICNYNKEVHVSEIYVFLHAWKYGCTNVILTKQTVFHLAK